MSGALDHEEDPQHEDDADHREDDQLIDDDREARDPLGGGGPRYSADEGAIRAILDRQTDAWNKHDMEAFVADTMPDVDWINVVGMHWKAAKR